MLPFEFILMMELWAIVCLEGNPSQFDAVLHNSPYKNCGISNW